MASPREPGAPDLLASAEIVVPGEVRSVMPARGGGNNRVYRVECADRAFALKWYPPQDDDRRDRLGVEFAALRFLERHGVAAVPRAFVADFERGLGVYEWLDGAPAEAPDAADIDAALNFIATLAALSGRDDAQALAPASAACLSGRAVVAQAQARLARLHQVAAAEPELEAFLGQAFAPTLEEIAAWAEARFARDGLDFEAELGPAERVLSASDFGFHNALRRSGGGLVFLDLEYFGWDDPAKLVADFLHHPGMTLEPGLKRRFLEGAGAVLGERGGFALRFPILYPLYGLCWCLILLNEFRPERWRRRALAGAGDRRRSCARQLDKARRLHTNLRESYETGPSIH